MPASGSACWLSLRPGFPWSRVMVISTFARAARCCAPSIGRAHYAEPHRPHSGGLLGHGEGSQPDRFDRPERRSMLPGAGSAAIWGEPHMALSLLGSASTGHLAQVNRLAVVNLDKSARPHRLRYRGIRRFPPGIGGLCRLPAKTLPGMPRLAAPGHHQRCTSTPRSRGGWGQRNCTVCPGPPMVCTSRVPGTRLISFRLRPRAPVPAPVGCLWTTVSRPARVRHNAFGLTMGARQQ